MAVICSSVGAIVRFRTLHLHHSLFQNLAQGGAFARHTKLWIQRCRAAGLDESLVGSVQLPVFKLGNRGPTVAARRSKDSK